MALFDLVDILVLIEVTARVSKRKFMDHYWDMKPSHHNSGIMYKVLFDGY